MKKHLFLTGPSGCGKTTLIREALGVRLSFAGGFVTERTLSGSGSLLGYDLLPAAAAAGVSGYMPLRFLDYSVEPPVSDNEVFRVNAVQLLQEAEYYPFSLIDEFGGFEMIIPQFRAALADFLSSEQPIIGVLKSPAGAEEIRGRLGLGQKLTAYTDRLRQALEADEDTVILTMSSRGDETAKRIVEQWVKEYAAV